LDLDLGLYTIEHPEIIVGVIVYSIAKRGSQTSFKKSALLSSRALFSFQIASRVGAVQGLLFQAGLGSVPKGFRTRPQD
jgi:hypothetical protein